MPDDSASWFESVYFERERGSGAAGLVPRRSRRHTHKEPVQDLKVELGPRRHVGEGWKENGQEGQPGRIDWHAKQSGSQDRQSFLSSRLRTVLKRRRTFVKVVGCGR